MKLQAMNTNTWYIYNIYSQQHNTTRQCKHRPSAATLASSLSVLGLLWCRGRGRWGYRDSKTSSITWVCAEV